ncbi:MAG: ribosome maturation factor RimM [Flavobacteriales bacterium]|nr:ribosome maturation factor RimM [Flavobacteriales bacterium]
MASENLTVFGHIFKPHGLKGSLKVKLIGGMIPQIEKDEPVFIPLQGGPVPFFAEERADTSRDFIVLKLEGIDTVGAAADFVGKDVLIDRARLTEEEPTGLHALIGYSVTDVDLGHLGTVTDVLEMTMQSVLEIGHPTGKQVLIPAVDHILLAVDEKKRVLTVDTPDGLVDIYLHG